MKQKLLLSFIFLLLISPLVAQDKTTTIPLEKPKRNHTTAFLVSGSLGAGATVSSNVVNSGGVLPFRADFAWQKKSRRMGFGLSKELLITPQALFEGAVNGQFPGLSKLYFVYEKYIFRNSPVNLGFVSHLGFFNMGDSTKSGEPPKGGLFANVGIALEVGIRPVYLFVRPDLEYQSWSGFHKQIQATGNVGVRVKFLTKAEKAYRDEKKEYRKEKRRRRKEK